MKEREEGRGMGTGTHTRGVYDARADLRALAVTTPASEAAATAAAAAGHTLTHTDASTQADTRKQADTANGRSEGERERRSGEKPACVLCGLARRTPATTSPAQQL